MRLVIWTGHRSGPVEGRLAGRPLGRPTMTSTLKGDRLYRKYRLIRERSRTAQREVRAGPQRGRSRSVAARTARPDEKARQTPIHKSRTFLRDCFTCLPAV